MAKTTSEKKSGVAEKAKAAEVKAPAAVQADEAKTRGNEKAKDAPEQPEVKAPAEKEAEKSEEKKESKSNKGFQFNVSADGFVEVISEKRAGKAVYGATGDIIKFDEKGCAKVKLEDAMHFSQVPGFSFK